MTAEIRPTHRPYPEYKDSGIEWLGDIPAHWDTARVKYLGWFNYGDSLASDSREDGQVPVCGSNGPVGTHSSANTLAPAIIVGRKGSFGKVNFSDEPCFAIDTTYFIDPSSARADIRWLYYALPLLKLDSLSQDSAIPGLSREFAHNQHLPKPPLPEQRTIAAFLDRETARIDALIEKKQRLIDLLQEKRTALISHAVTKGLDPSVPMKDSGVEWLGEIPAHWEVERNKHLFQERDERSQTGEEELLTVSHITGITPRSEKDVTMFMAESLEGYKICYPGDLVINTMWAWMGALGTSPLHGVVSPSYNVYKMRRKEQFDPQYLGLLYRTPQHVAEINRYSKGIWSSRLRLYPDAFFEMYTPVPLFDEQQRIVQYIDETLSESRRLQAKLEGSIEHLREYRTALISAAVTGKIDVRSTRHCRRNPSNLGY